MNKKVWETIEKYGMLRPGDSVIVGLSGGADSCALLHCLCSLREAMNLTVYACHVHHGIRGKEADKDRDFTIKLCHDLRVEWFGLEADIPTLSRRRGLSEEQCGREVRYAFFQEKAQELSAKIATAHTASDNAETILLNLMRGSGLTGLCGIPPVRENIIRPLVEVTREEVEAYCRENGLTYVTDSTNLSRKYTRNRLRLDVLPVLRELNPALEKVLTRQSMVLRETDDWLREQGKQALRRAQRQGGYDCAVLRGLDRPVFAAAVRILCSEYTIIPDARHIELMAQIVYNSGAVELRDGVFAVSGQGIFRVVRPEAPAFLNPVPFQDWETGSEMVIADKKITLSLVNIEDYYNRKKNNKLLFLFSLDYGTIPLTSVFRTRQAGDRFAPMNRGLTKPVRRLFQEMKIPAETRDGIPLLADGNEVLWIDGVGVSEKCRITNTTEQVLILYTEGLHEKGR